MYCVDSILTKLLELVTFNQCFWMRARMLVVLVVYEVSQGECM